MLDASSANAGDPPTTSINAASAAKRLSSPSLAQRSPSTSIPTMNTPLLQRSTEISSTSLQPLINKGDEYKPQRPLLYLGRIASWWVGYSMIYTMSAMLWPVQIANIVGDSQKYTYIALLPAITGPVAFVVTPIAGIISDHTTTRWGRRRLFVVIGSVVVVLCLLLAIRINTPSHSIWTFMLCLAGIQFGLAFAGGPFAGLLPDVVPESQVPVGSSFLGTAVAAGYLLGGVISRVFSDETQEGVIWPVYIVYIACFGTSLLPTLTVAERVIVAKEKLSIIQFFKNFYLDPKKYRNFYWVIISRAFQEMGVFSIVPFFTLFIQDVLLEPQYVQSATNALIILVCFSLPFAYIAGPWSERWGSKRLVYLSSFVMFLSTVLFIGICRIPSIYAVYAVSGVLGAGYGIYQTVDWSLALETIPPDANVAKDMGIWNLALVGPQIIAPFLSSAVLDLKQRGYEIHNLYTATFTIAAVYFMLATVCIYFVKLEKKPGIDVNRAAAFYDTPPSKHGGEAASSYPPL